MNLYIFIGCGGAESEMTALLCALLLVTLVGSDRPTEEERQLIVAFHNAKRATVDPPAAKMMELVYNRRLERLAYEWAERCTARMPLYGYVSQYDDNPVNIAYSDEPVRNITALLIKWWDEVHHYHYEGNTCDVTMCGHYLLMVWGDTAKIGCAIQHCDTVKHGPGKESYVLVCSYTPPGRLLDELPYVKGDSCSKCPNGTRCINNLCSEMKGSSSSSGSTGNNGNSGTNGNAHITSTASTVWAREIVLCFMLIIFLSVW